MKMRMKMETSTLISQLTASTTWLNMTIAIEQDIQLPSPVQQHIAQLTALVSQLSEKQQPLTPVKPPAAETIAISPVGVSVTPVAGDGILQSPEGRGRRATRVKVESISPPCEWG